MVMNKIKALKELLEESPEAVAKVLRSLKGESDDAVQKLGSGKNLEALKKAKEAAPSMEAPAYPKNITQDALGPKPEITERGFQMFDDSNLPVVRGETLPANIPDMQMGKAPKFDINASSLQKPDAVIPNPFKAGQAAPQGLGDIADSMKGQVDDLLDPNARAKKIAAGAGLAGLALPFMMGEEEQAVNVAQPPVQPQQPNIPPVAPAPKQAGPQKTSAEGFLPGDKETLAKAEQERFAKEQAQVTPDDYVNQLKAAQEKDARQQIINDITASAERLGSGLSRTAVDKDYIKDAQSKDKDKNVNNLKTLMSADMDQKKLKKVQSELDDEAKLRDPKSDVSTAFRQALAKLGIKHTDKTSAADAKAMGINIQNLLMQDKALAAQQGKLDKAASDKAKAFKMGAYKVLQKPFSDYQKVAQAYDSVSALNDHLSQPNGAKDIQTLYSFIKGLDPQSSVKEGEIALSQQGISAFDKLGIKAKNLTTGQILSPTFRKQIIEVLKTQKDLAEKDYQDKVAPLFLQGADYGLTEEDYGDIDPLSAMKAKAAKQGPAGNAAPVRSAAEQKAIQLVMQKNNVSEADAVNALKKAGKIK